MPMTDLSSHLIEEIPDPETVRLLLADAIRSKELLRSLLRVAQRKANYPPPKRPDIQNSTSVETAVPRG